MFFSLIHWKCICYLLVTQAEADTKKKKKEEKTMERFEDHIKLHHLKKLMKQFGHHRPTDEMPMDGTFSPGRIIKREPGNVTLGEFKQMLTSMGIDTTEWDTQMELLFAKVC